jgi:hypothetical protein
MLVNILLQDGRTNYIEGVLCTSCQQPLYRMSALADSLPNFVSTVIALYLIIALAYFVSE